MYMLIAQAECPLAKWNLVDINLYQLTEKDKIYLYRIRIPYMTGNYIVVGIVRIYGEQTYRKE
jgi:hypothetical protein